MLKIESFWTHNTKPSGGRGDISAVRAHDGVPVSDFRELVQRVGELAYRNPSLNLLYRGQGQDYCTNGLSTIRPTLFRPPSGKSKLSKKLREQRVEKLTDYADILRQKHDATAQQIGLKLFPEYQWALLQHYECCDTPLVDVTHSLRVAASFALLRSHEGFVYVFGMPHLQGSVSHFVDLRMVAVRLQSVCPPAALRPHFQEGCLVGRLPFTGRPDSERNDLTCRMIGKYRIKGASFWRSGFAAIPKKALLPRNDPFERTLRGLLKLPPR